MSRRRVESVRDDVIAAIAEVRSVARAEQDEAWNRTADYLDAQFASVTVARAVRAAAAGTVSFAQDGTKPQRAMSRCRSMLPSSSLFATIRHILCRRHVPAWRRCTLYLLGVEVAEKVAGGFGHRISAAHEAILPDAAPAMVR